MLLKIQFFFNKGILTWDHTEFRAKFSGPVSPPNFTRERTIAKF